MDANSRGAPADLFGSVASIVHSPSKPGGSCASWFATIRAIRERLNAFEFHTDETKRTEIEKLHQLMPLARSRAIFTTLMIEKVKAIMNIANFIELLLARADSIETTSRPKEAK